MIKTKKQMFALIGTFILTIMLGTVTYAFFNYTRTGASNVIKTGRIAFNTTQSSGTSEAINLTNVFPITRSELGTDVNNSAEVEINITGDTTYTNGLEYLVTFEDVNIETSTNKKIPIGIEITPEKTGELGTENTNYFNEGARGGNTSYYKVLADNVIHNGDYILVGYIRPGVAEINGTIGIKAFIDKDKILISDTYDGSESDNMGTPRSKAQGKVVLTTEEWNSLQGNNSISFKIRIQANEGIWVGEPAARNDMKSFSGTTVFTNAQKTAITEINFIRMSEEMINTHSDLIDLTADGGQGVVKAWVENNKLYIASPGETYFPVNSSSLLSGYPNVTKINFNNINTSLVVNMANMFASNDSLQNIDLSNFDTSNVTNMSTMFYGTFNLENINLSGLGSDSLSNVSSMFSSGLKIKSIDMSNFNFGNTTSLAALFSSLSLVRTINLKDADTSSVTDMSAMFNGCSNLVNVDLSGIDTSHVTSMTSMFYQCISLETLDLSSFDTRNVTSTHVMFAMTDWTSTNGYTPVNNSLTTIYVGSNWNLSNVTGSDNMFYNCTHLVGGSGTVFDSNYIDKTYAKVDGGLSNPGYLTLKTN